MAHSLRRNVAGHGQQAIQAPEGPSHQAMLSTVNQQGLLSQAVELKGVEMSGKTDLDIWTVRELVERLTFVAGSTNYASKAQVRIPSFQRPLVWNQSKREALIKSVLEGFPIGSLLLWRDPQDPESYLLVDGQQRSATLKEHANADLAFLTESALSASTTISESISNLQDAIVQDTPESDISTHLLTQEILHWLLAKRTTSNESYHNMSLLSALSENGTKFNQTNAEIANCAERVIRSIESAVNVSNMRIPVLIYTGPDSDLDEIFVKLNEQGVPLTKYQVWAARWARTEVLNPSKAILDEQDLRLTAMRKQGLQYQDEGPSTSVNIFEYLNSMGHLFATKYVDLFSPVAHPKEQAYGFSLALLYFDLDLARKSAEQLPDKIHSYGSNAMLDFYNHIDQACRTVSKSLRVLAALQLQDKPGLLPHPDLQIVALVSWLAREVRSGRKIDKPELLEAINARYVFDLLAESFRGPGDALAHERVHQLDGQGVPNYYRVKPSREQFIRALDTWMQEDIENTKKKRPITQESLKQFILRVISSKHVPTTEQAEWFFDVDHIEALASELFKDETPGSADLAPHQLGNLCLLESSLNRKKGKLSLAGFLGTLNEKEREFVVRVGRLREELIDGNLSEAKNASVYIERTKIRQDVLIRELIEVLKY